MSGQSRAEACFYDTHFRIESHLVSAVRSLVDQEKDITVAKNGIDLARKELAIYRRSPAAGEFHKFRPIFFGHAGYPGPSGAQSAQIKCLDLLSNNRIYDETEKQKMNREAKSGMYPNFFANAANLLIELTEQSSEHYDIDLQLYTKLSIDSVFCTCMLYESLYLRSPSGLLAKQYSPI